MSLHAKKEVKYKTLLLGKRNQVTIPNEFIPEGTEQFTCESHEDGVILLIPSATIPVSQRYFWTKRWQKGEKEASEDAKAGRYTKYESVDELFNELEQRRKRKKRSSK